MPPVSAREVQGHLVLLRKIEADIDFASALAQKGVSLYVIAQLFGHTSTRMTMRYAHLHPANLRAAIESLPGR